MFYPLNLLILLASMGLIPVLEAVHFQGEAVNCPGAPISPDALSELAQADRIIQQDYAFPQISLKADRDALAKQLKAGAEDKVSLPQATQLALTVILDDFQSAEAPLNIAADGWASTHSVHLTGEPDPNQKGEIRRFLREQMQDSRTSLGLYLGTIVPGQIYPPEQGESSQDNWIFVLTVPALSDHLYWVIVDRRGQKAPYLYGFN